MPRKLSSATKKADSILGKTKKSTVTKKAATLANQATSAGAEVPGLIQLTPDEIQGMLPQFNHGQYAVSDPLNPPETLPQVSESDFDRASKIYDGASRALDLTAHSLDLTTKRFGVFSKQSKAIGAGLKALTAIETAKTDYLDWQSSIESLKQKQTGLDVSRHQTSQGELAAVHLKTELDERLHQAQIRAETAELKTHQALQALNEFRASLPNQ